MATYSSEHNINTGGKKYFIFLPRQKSKLQNYILTLYIKLFANVLDVNIFIVILKDRFRCEKYIAYLNNKLAKFLPKWGPLRQVNKPNMLRHFCFCEIFS